MDETENIQNKSQFRVKNFTDHKACSLLLIFISNKHEPLASFCWGRCLCGRRESFVPGSFVALLSRTIHSHSEAIKEATISVMNQQRAVTGYSVMPHCDKILNHHSKRLKSTEKLRRGKQFYRVAEGLDQILN